MGFFTNRCPNCGNSVSKEADHCSYCGCPSATAWATCPNCGTSVGADSKFCWKCGQAQDPSKRNRFYGDRWHRASGDFAVRVEMKTPEAILHKGLQVDEGTVALIFQNGKFKGTCEAGYHTTDTFFARLLGFDKGAEAHAILLDIRSAEVDFSFENVRLQNQIPVDLRLRLLFQVTNVQLFVSEVVRDNENFTAFDLSSRFAGEIGQVVRAALANKNLDELFANASARDLIEKELDSSLKAILEPAGLQSIGLRLAQFGGKAYDELREKMGEIDRLNRELEVNRRLMDVTRSGKVETYRDEQQLREQFDKIAHEMKLGIADREEELKRFTSACEHKTQMDALRTEYELRRSEITARLDEQKLRHQSELADVMHAVELRKVEFEEDIRQQQVRFDEGQHQQTRQSETDLEVAKSGINALKLVKQAKFEARQKEDAQDIQMEQERLKLRGNASVRALLATLTGEQADRVLKLAEIEMRRGLTPEQSLALIAEKSPEIAPAIAQAIQARAGRKN